MKTVRPQSPQHFVEHLRALVDAAQYRRAVAYAERFSRGFLPQLSAEELNRVTAMMEGADMIVDLEDREATRRRYVGDPRTRRRMRKSEPIRP
ncbi:MAG: hypothetical protein M3442_17090 [Chloroflexota bacterium]|nr:hypothetical protein [Chloroflexota bacterium]